MAAAGAYASAASAGGSVTTRWPHGSGPYPGRLRAGHAARVCQTAIWYSCVPRWAI